MFRPRIIPCLQLSNGALVKTKAFRDPVYVGDPLNATMIFSECAADELLVIGIDAPEPPWDVLQRIAGMCTAPLTYGGGIRDIEQIARLIHLGIEKVSINAAALNDAAFIRAAADRFGSQCIVVSMDVRGEGERAKVFGKRGHEPTAWTAVEYARHAQAYGAGELLVTSVDREGGMQGYDLPLIRALSGAVNIPIIAHGGAGTLNDMHAAIDAGASAAAAGSMFVFHKRRGAVLIQMPLPAECP